MKRITEWEAFCGCIVHYSWDDKTSDEERVHTFEKLVKACEDHAPMLDGKKIYEAMEFETQFAQKAIHKLASMDALLGTEVFGEDGSSQGFSPKENVMSFRFNKERYLIISIKEKSFTEEIKENLKNKLLEEGFDTVIIE